MVDGRGISASQGAINSLLYLQQCNKVNFFLCNGIRLKIFLLKMQTLYQVLSLSQWYQIHRCHMGTISPLVYTQCLLLSNKHFQVQVQAVYVSVSEEKRHTSLSIGLIIHVMLNSKLPKPGNSLHRQTHNFSVFANIYSNFIAYVQNNSGIMTNYHIFWPKIYANFHNKILMKTKWRHRLSTIIGFNTTQLKYPDCVCIVESDTYPSPGVTRLYPSWLGTWLTLSWSGHCNMQWDTCYHLVTMAAGERVTNQSHYEITLWGVLKYIYIYIHRYKLSTVLILHVKVVIC